MYFVVVKRMVFSLCVMLQGLGLTLIACGIFFIYTGIMAENFFGCLFVGLGAVIMIIAIFGFLAAIYEAPVCLLMFTGVLVLMIRIHVFLIEKGSQIEDTINEEIDKASQFIWIGLVPDPTKVSDLRNWISWLIVLKKVCWLLIVAEGVGALSAWLLYRNIRNLRAK